MQGILEGEPLTIGEALKSFMGYLEGTSKSRHTIASYRFDCEAFFDFLVSKGFHDLEPLSPLWIRAYCQELEKRPLLPNSKRRQLLTLTKLLNFLHQRNKLPKELAGPLPAPLKIERMRYDPGYLLLQGSLQSLEPSGFKSTRDVLIAWVILETGLLVSEVPKLLKAQVLFAPSMIEKRGGVCLALSSVLCSRLEHFMKQQEDCSLVFPSSLSSTQKVLTDRSVELIVKSVGARVGVPELTPRLLRDARIFEWMRQGVPIAEMQTRLGLKTSYAFKFFDLHPTKPALAFHD
jgi:site-specific recombinase XerD